MMCDVQKTLCQLHAPVPKMNVNQMCSHCNEAQKLVAKGMKSDLHAKILEDTPST